MPLRVQDKFWARLELWQEDPANSLLYLHPLSGKLAGCYSINITGDIRAIYEIVGEEAYIFDMIGSHSQLYG
ncbi:MAG: type II toxin-antitoxin system RelE/ParE family toxin [Candidatus Saccharimonadales bacterium]